MASVSMFSYLVSALVTVVEPDAFISQITGAQTQVAIAFDL